MTDPVRESTIDQRIEDLEYIINGDGLRAIQDAKAKVPSARLYRVPSIYYNMPYSWRKESLKAQSEVQLCKTLFFENVLYNGDEDFMEHPHWCRYYAVITQYTSKLNTQQLRNFIGYHPGNFNRSVKSNFKLRAVEPETAAELTGYQFNAHTVFGMRQPVPIIIDQKVLDIPHSSFFMGGGEVDLKIKVNTREFIEGTGALIFNEHELFSKK
ncbi:hypothetical protein PCE1_002509 [Barthelona sp. PCE]